MSLYRRSLLFLGWIAVLMLIALITLAKFIDQPDGGYMIAAFAVIWLAHGAASLWLFCCPVCRTSPFVSKVAGIQMSHPWPRKTCSGCGANLTKA